MEFDICRARRGALREAQAEAEAGKREWIFFCEEGAEPEKSTFAAIEEAISEAGEDFAAFEPRTLPYENGKYYNPVTLETNCLGVCFAVRRAAFVQAGGFEGVRLGTDAAALSARLRAHGWKLRYVPGAVVKTADTGGRREEGTEDMSQAQRESDAPGVFIRAGGKYAHVPPTIRPAFTVVIRTFQRPDVLRLTLQSLRWQTYKAFSVIVVEDGEMPISEEAVNEAKAWLDIAYVAANAHWGRCRAGNEGVARAKTEYVCFLDDDDYWFAEHLEVMARAIEDHPDSGLWCARAIEGRCPAGVRAEFIVKRNMGKDNLRALDFCLDNPVPIQAVVFRKSLYEACGGLDPNQDALEDWDLWLRMVSRAPVTGIPKATSIYRVPFEQEIYAARREAIERYQSQLYEKMRAYPIPIPAREIYDLHWGQNGGTLHKKEEELDRAAWYVKARELSSSTSWKLSAPIRRLLAALGKAAGPAVPNWDAATAQELYLYCYAVEHSPFWCALHWGRR